MGMNEDENTPVSQTHARSEICVGKGLPRTMSRGASWRETFACGLRGEGSVTKGGCLRKVYCEQVCVGKFQLEQVCVGQICSIYIIALSPILQ